MWVVWCLGAWVGLSLVLSMWKSLRPGGESGDGVGGEVRHWSVMALQSALFLATLIAAPVVAIPSVPALGHGYCRVLGRCRKEGLIMSAAAHRGPGVLYRRTRPVPPRRPKPASARGTTYITRGRAAGCLSRPTGARALCRPGLLS